jgi:hypothetical protein
VIVTWPFAIVPERVGAAGREEKFTAGAVCRGGVQGVVLRAGGVIPAAQKGHAGNALAAAAAGGAVASAEVGGVKRTAPAASAATTTAPAQRRVRDKSADMWGLRVFDGWG